MSHVPRQRGEVQAVIFDLDGTLADTLPMIVEAFELTFQEFGMPLLTQDEIFAHFGPTEDGVIRAMFGDVSAAAVPVFYDAYQELLNGGIAPFPGIRELVAQCMDDGRRLAVVTGKSVRGAAMTLAALDLADVFEFVRSGSDDGLIKASAITDLVDGWSIRPDQAVYIGDHPLDVAEARKARVGAIAAAWASSSNIPAIVSAKPDELFLTVDELAKWLDVREPAKGRE